MSRIQVGDTVAFRRDIAQKCISPQKIAAVRGTVTQVTDGWLFLTEMNGRERVMPVASMSKVAASGVILELV